MKRTFIYDNVVYEIDPEALECHPVIVLKGGSQYKIINIHQWGDGKPPKPTASCIKYNEDADWRPRSGTAKWAIAHNLQ